MKNPGSFSAPIGVFDSGYGGLTILEGLLEAFPEYDYLYLGDNARSPYGQHSFETIYRYTRQAVNYLFSKGCPLVLLACNTASARALRSIQQIDLPKSEDPSRRVLGIIRPTVEVLGEASRNKHVGLLATKATVESNTYGIEVSEYFPEIKLSQHPAPMWVPLVEQGEYTGNPGVDFFVEREVKTLLSKDPEMDTIQLACTHYPLLLPVIRKFVPDHIKILGQSRIMNNATQDYLRRHPEMESRLSRGGTCRLLTTESDAKFGEMVSRFAQSSHLSQAPVDHIVLETSL